MMTDIKELEELDKKYFLHPTTPLKLHQQEGPANIFVEGKGIYLTDIHGNQYIDGVSTLWNVNIGHGRKEIAEVAKEQMSKLAYTSSFNRNSHEPVIRLCEKLASLTPKNLNVSFFTSGGSESNDTAFKLVRYYWKLKQQPLRTKVIGLKRAYHGVTIGATSATGIPQFQDFATERASGFLQAEPFVTNGELGDRNDPNYKGCIRDIIETEGPETIAAVILEPVQGAGGGVAIPPDGYLQAVRQLCDEYGIKMIVDEVICGFGRTGEMFGVNNWDVVPDLMTVAKGITSGYIQLGAVIMKEQLRDELMELTDGVLFHGFTYSAHPTACAVALKNLEIIEDENLVENAKRMERELKQGLDDIAEKHSVVKKQRVLGLLGAFELYADPESGTPFAPSVGAAQKVVNECMKRKLIVRPITFEGVNIIAIAPPLITKKEEIETIIHILSDALKAFEQEVR